MFLCKCDSNSVVSYLFFVCLKPTNAEDFVFEYLFWKSIRTSHRKKKQTYATAIVNVSAEKFLLVFYLSINCQFRIIKSDTRPVVGSMKGN